MKSDLRNLATYEEQYAADNNGAYFSGNRHCAGLYAVAERDGNSSSCCRPAANLDRDCDALAVGEDLQQLDRRDRLRLKPRLVE